MQWWKQFIDSLASRGAAILLLVLTSTGLFFGVVHVLHHGDEGNMSSTIVATFSGFCGALLTVLSTQGKAQNGNSEPIKPPTQPSQTNDQAPNGGK